MGDDAVDLILRIFVFCENFSLLYLLYDAIDKLKTFSVGSLNRFFIRQVNVRLNIRRFLSTSL